LRVAWDNSLARRNPAGTGVYASNLIRELSARPDVDLTVFEGWDPSKRERGEFGQQGVLSRGMRGVIGVVSHHVYFPYLLRKGHFDVFHSPGFVVPMLCPCPSVVTVYDLSFKLFPRHFERRWTIYLNHVMPSVLRSVSAVICISECSRQDLFRFYKIAPDKVHVVHCGIDHAQFRPGTLLDPDWARSAGIRGDYVLHVGTLAARKNIPVLLRAVAALRSRGKFRDLQLVLAGAELSVLTGGPQVHTTIRECGLGDVVVLPGHIPNEILPGLYASAKLLAMPSVYEGFGLPVLESMASGTPVVASDSSSLPEVAGDAAILVPSQDEAGWAEAIQRILETPSLAQEMRRKGLSRAQQFGWERAAEETLAVYRTVAGR
jgi:glycosyltransferase involved in cell wall biosynthesis